MNARPGTRRTLAAGVAGGLAFVLGTFLTFAQLGGSREGATGLLFDPDTQHPKVIAAWKQIEPLPRIVEQPAVILLGMVLFGLSYAFLYRLMASSWPAGVRARVPRLAVVIWVGTVFAEFMGPFNVLHQPIQLSLLAWTFWAVAALLEALAIVMVLEWRPSAVRLPRRAGGYLAVGGGPPGGQQAPAGTGGRVPGRLWLPGGHRGRGR